MKQLCRYTLFGFVAMAMVALPSQAAQPSTNSVIVIGKLKNQTYEHIWDPDDFLGHGWVTATLQVSRVVKGKIPKRDLTVRYYTHAALREDRKFRFRLIPAETVDYLICADAGHSGVKCD